MKCKRSKQDLYLCLGSDDMEGGSSRWRHPPTSGSSHLSPHLGKGEKSADMLTYRFTDHTVRLPNIRELKENKERSIRLVAMVDGIAIFRILFVKIVKVPLPVIRFIQIIIIVVNCLYKFCGGYYSNLHRI